MSSPSGFRDEGDDESPNEDNFPGSEDEDDLEELSDEEDDDAVLGRMNFDNNFHPISPPEETLEFISRDNTVWTNDIPTGGRRAIVNKWTSRNQKFGFRGEVQRVRDAMTKLAIFNLQITDEMVDSIVKWTNKYAREILEGSRSIAPVVPSAADDNDDDDEHEDMDHGIDSDHESDWEAAGTSSKQRKWRKTDRIEMTAFIGLLIMAGVERNRKNPTHLIWTSQKKYIKPAFVATMSRDRFQDILRFIRFDDKASRDERKKADKLTAIRYFCDEMVSNIYEIYEPGAHLCVDEMLVKFRGRCPFRVYMKNKPAKYGIKIWSLVDAESRFVCNFQVYLGKQGGKTEQNQGKRVLMDMCRKFFGTWRGVTADNFFGSKNAAEELMKNQLTSIFTMRSIRREIPREILDIRNVQDSKFLWNDNTMLVGYKAKQNKVVLLMSTQHQIPLVHKQPPKKPEVIFDYNATRGGVDSVDQMVAEYTCRRRSNRWPLTVFMQAVDMAALNAKVIFEQKHPAWRRGKRCRRLIFLRELAEEMIMPQINRRKWGSLKVHVRDCLSVMGAVPPPPPSPKTGQEKSYCHVCKLKKQRTRQKCDACQTFSCDKCSRRLCKICEKQ